MSLDSVVAKDTAGSDTAVVGRVDDTAETAVTLAFVSITSSAVLLICCVLSGIMITLSLMEV
jgi:hypothetical protein